MDILYYVRVKVLFLLLICLIFVGGQYKVAYTGSVTATAYNSLPNQTDDSPWTTASGTRCRTGVIASNHLPMGTKVMIEGFGDKVFTVEDRMNKRYYRRIDIWFRDYGQARRFGVKKVKYYVLAKA
jgi:3D (Asp-Asp-Asp) domain-containing protein